MYIAKSQSEGYYLKAEAPTLQLVAAGFAKDGMTLMEEGKVDLYIKHYAALALCLVGRS